MGIVSGVVFLLRALFGDRAAIAAENLTLRRKLAVLHMLMKRPRMWRRDRILWVWLSKIWSGWRFREPHPLFTGESPTTLLNPRLTLFWAIARSPRHEVSITASATAKAVRLLSNHSPP